MAGGNQTEVAGEGALAVEPFRILHLAEQVHGCQHTDAGYGKQEFHTGCIRFAAGQLSDSAGDGEQVGTQPVDLRHQQVERLPGGGEQTHVLTQPQYEPGRPVCAGSGEAIREADAVVVQKMLDARLVAAELLLELRAETEDAPVVQDFLGGDIDRLAQRAVT